MGNFIPPVLMDNRNLEVSERLVRDFQEQIRRVDTSMSGLVKTIDAMGQTYEMFLRQVDSRKEIQETDDKDKMADAEELAARLLKTIHDSVSDQRKSAVESITKLLHTIIDAGARFIAVPKDIELSLDEYMNHLSKNLEHEVRPYYETRVELLKKELKIVKELNAQQNDQITILNKEVGLSQKEIDLLRKRNKYLVEDITALKVENAKQEKNRPEISLTEIVKNTEKPLAETNSALVEVEWKNMRDEASKDGERKLQIHENHFEPLPCDIERNVSDYTIAELEKTKEEFENLKSEMDKIKRMECIHVQIFNKAYTTTPIDQLIETIASKVDTKFSKLFIVKEGAEPMKVEVPRIVFFNTGHGLQQAARKALGDMSDLNGVALVAIHRVDTPSSVTPSMQALPKNSFKQLSGIFDVVYNVKDNFYQCDVNDKNINKLAEFILMKGVRISALETHGLC